MNTHQQGAQGEAQAATYLQQKGYRLLARNFRSNGGEIDLIFTRHQILVFVEVKQRSTPAFGGPLAAVTPAKQQRIARTAQQFIKANPRLSYNAIRFDVLCILPGNMEHIENAFTPGRSTL